ncbi:hypothetical protein GF342_03045 [Candidatus Woesearchaeota archaeon]|nr:hypothetical protein [Candidatus Woesearchaeota archaeon]
MKITKDIIEKAVKHMLRVLDKENITSAENLRQFETHGAGHIFAAEGNDLVRVHMKPSKDNTYAHVFSYVKEGLYVTFSGPKETEKVPISPVEIKINTAHRNFTIFCTYKKKLPGFEAFDRTDEGDWLQDKTMPLDYKTIREELKALPSLL